MRIKGLLQLLLCLSRLRCFRRGKHADIEMKRRKAGGTRRILATLILSTRYLTNDTSSANHSLPLIPFLRFPSPFNSLSLLRSASVVILLANLLAISSEPGRDRHLEHSNRSYTLSFTVSGYHHKTSRQDADGTGDIAAPGGAGHHHRHHPLHRLPLA